MKSNEKILTIVVPTYNMEKYLSQCLDSFIYDDKTNDIEVLVVNDGSKDRSLEIAKNYEKRYPNIFKVIDKENGGHGSTINAGLKVAQGKYFKVVDSDDCVDTQVFAEYVEKLKNIDVDLVCTKYTVFYDNSTKTEQIDNLETFEKNIVLNLENVKNFNFCIHQVTYKTEVVCSMKLQEKCFYEDVEYNLYGYELCNTVEFLDYYVYRYRLGRIGQSVSVAGILKHNDNLSTIINNIVLHCDGKNVDTCKNRNIIKYVLQIIENYYYNSLLIYNKRKNVKNDLLSFDKWLSEYKVFYDESGKNSRCIRILRKFKFRFLWLFSLYVRINYKG